MSKVKLSANITKESSIAEVGAIVCEALTREGLDVFLSGGAVVSIYTQNRYESYDLDFVTLSDRNKIKKVMTALGFSQEKSRHFIHPNSNFFVEFPGSAMKIGEEFITEFSELKLPVGTLKLLTPTDSVKDRLSAYIHWNDKQGLDQAVWIAELKDINLQSIENWAKKEKGLKQLSDFKKRLKKKLKNKL